MRNATLHLMTLLLLGSANALLAAPPPHAEAAKKKAVESTVDIQAPGVFDFSYVRLVDLTHSYNQETMYWPGEGARFELKSLAHGKTEGGYFYSANAFSTPEHGGTHMDAPLHFFEKGRSVDEMPLERLTGPIVVLDISEKVRENPDYLLTMEDFDRFELRNDGRIPKGSYVLVRTGWDQHWGDAQAYLGTADGDVTKLRFPSIHPAVGRTLIRGRKISGLGIDTPSVDPAQSKTFDTHIVAAIDDVAILENLTNLHLLPERGAWVFALPMKIEGGSGAPVRVLALVKEEGPRPPNRDD
ncbi:MAG TPA: cyclase family protein [Thermoanaerobaculia bacterium]|nr:cyclase family protein [Thermoanaerobaculia bacterium]